LLRSTRHRAGLDYYTGPVFEALLIDALEFGRWSERRYDGLVARFSPEISRQSAPSIGVDRLLAAMTKLGLTETAPSTAQVLVTVMETGEGSSNMKKLTREFRRQASMPTYLGRRRGFQNSLPMRTVSRYRSPFSVGKRRNFQKGK